MDCDQLVFCKDFIEYSATQKNARWWREQLGIYESRYNLNFSGSSPNHVLRWKNIAAKMSGDTSLGLWCDRSGRHPDEAIEELGQLLGINLLSILPASAFKGELAKREFLTAIDWTKKKWPNQFKAGTREYTLQGCLEIKGWRGYISAVLCLYRDAAEEITGVLPLHVYEHSLTREESPFNEGSRHLDIKIGVGEGHFFFWKYEKIAHQHGAKIILCEDPFLAHRFNTALEENPDIANSEIIISTWFGEIHALHMMEHETLKGREVYFVPAANRTDYKRIAKYYRSWGDKAGSFKIYPDEMAYTTLDSELVFKTILASSYSFDEYKSAFAQKNKEKKQVDLNGEHYEASYVSATEVLKELGSTGHSTKNLNDIVSPGYMTLIYGPSNVGKGFIALSIAVAYAAGVGVFNFTSDGKQRKAFYVAGEEPRKDYAAKLKRVMDALDVDFHPAIGQIIVREDPNWSGVSFKEEKWQQQLELEIKQFRQGSTDPCILILDNLTTLYSSNTLSFVERMYDWLRRLEQEYQLAVVLCHHTNTKDELRGCKDIENLMGTILKLEKIRGEKLRIPKSEKDYYSPYIKEDGALTRINIEKCKVDSQREYTKTGFFLARDPAGRPEGPGWVCLSPEYRPQTIKELAVKYGCVFTPREEAVVLILTTTSQITCLDAAKCIGKKKGTALKLINGLVEKKVIRQVEGTKARSTKYELVPISDSPSITPCEPSSDEPHKEESPLPRVACIRPRSQNSFDPESKN